MRENRYKPINYVDMYALSCYLGWFAQKHHVHSLAQSQSARSETRHCFLESLQVVNYIIPRYNNPSGRLLMRRTSVTG